MKLKDKVAVITGAASERSIGWGIAKALAGEGANIVLNDLPSQNQELAARTESLREMGVKAAFVEADLTESNAAEHIIQSAVSEMGHLDIAVSNAGIIRWENFLDITPDVLKLILGVNIKGNMLFCQAAAREMIRRQKGGRIIITSSVQAYTHFTVSPVYGGTKHAMHIFVGALALELAPYNITVNHFGPGWIRTPLNDIAPGQQTEEDIKNQKASIPLHRAGTIEEMGQAALYLASPGAAYTTGAFIQVDGGLGIGKYPK